MFDPQITIRDVPFSPILETNIRKKVEKFNNFYDHINSCRVIVKLAQKHKHQGKLYNVSIELTVPTRKRLVTTRKNNEDIYVALRDACEAMSRQLEEYGRKRHGRVKAHTASVAGHVVRVYPKEGYGFIEGIDGTEYYFSINNVSYPHFDQLLIGDRVAFIPEPLSEGWHAHHVILDHHLLIN